MTAGTTAPTTVGTLDGDVSLDRWKELLAEDNALEVVQTAPSVDWETTASSVDCFVATLEALEPESFDTVRRLFRVDEAVPIVAVAPPEFDQSVATALDLGVSYCVIAPSLEDARPLLRTRVNQLVARTGESPTNELPIIDTVGDAVPPSIMTTDGGTDAETPPADRDPTTQPPADGDDVEQSTDGPDDTTQLVTDPLTRADTTAEPDERRSIRQRLAGLSKAIVSPLYRNTGSDGQPSSAESSSSIDPLSSNLDESAHSNTTDTDTPPSTKRDTSGLPDSAATNATETEGHSHPTYHDLEAGTSVLLESEPHDHRRGTCCTGLLGNSGDPATDILLIRYTPIRKRDLEAFVASANRVGLIAVGHRQPFSEDLRDDVEYLEVSNPNDVTRVGILTTRLVDEWATSQPVDVGTAVCFDSLDILLQYKDRYGAFRFFHLLLSKLESVDAITHVHVNPSTQRSKDIATLGSLFDTEVVVKPTQSSE